MKANDLFKSLKKFLTLTVQNNFLNHFLTYICGCLCFFIQSLLCHQNIVDATFFKETVFHS